MNMDQIKSEMKKYGLLRLSKDSGMARSYLHRVANGETSPTLESLEKILAIIGLDIKFEYKILEDSVADVTDRVANDGNWKIHYFNFVDSFRRTQDRKLIMMPPSDRVGEREKSLISSMTMQLCFELDITHPDWTKENHCLPEPWFVAGVESLKPMAIVESSPFFKRNNIFVLENFLSRV